MFLCGTEGVGARAIRFIEQPVIVNSTLPSRTSVQFGAVIFTKANFVFICDGCCDGMFNCLIYTEVLKQNVSTNREINSDEICGKFRAIFFAHIASLERLQASASWPVSVFDAIEFEVAVFYALQVTFSSSMKLQSCLTDAF